MFLHPSQTFRSMTGALFTGNGLVCRSAEARGVASIAAGHLVWAATLMLVTLGLVGCDDGSANRILMRKACLEYVYEGYVAYLTTHDQGPSGFDTFDEFLAGESEEGPFAEVDELAKKLIADQMVGDEAMARLREG